MATSGSYDFNLTRNQIIETALRKVGALADGNIATNEQYESASTMLNMIVKNWRAQNIFIWDLDWITLPLTASSIVLGTDGVDYECIRPHTSSSENRPVTGSKYASFWKALTTTSGSAWVTSTSYTSICSVALDTNVVGVTDLRFRNGTSIILMTQLSRENYISLGDTTLSGTPSQYFFFRQPTPSLFFYPYPAATTYLIEAFVYRYPEDFDTSGDTSDLLQEWLLPLVDELAYRLGPSNGIFEQQLQDLRVQASESKSVAMMLDGEKGDVQFAPRTE